MDCRNPEKMDETIRSLLEAGPVEAVPSGFGRRVKLRVTLAAMLDWERQRWRYLSGAGFAGLIAVVACVVVPVAFPQVLEMTLSYLAPGGAGYADYVISQAWYGGLTLAAVVCLLVVISLAVGAVLTYLIQRVRAWSPMGRS